MILDQYISVKVLRIVRLKPRTNIAATILTLQNCLTFTNFATKISINRQLILAQQKNK